MMEPLRVGMIGCGAIAPQYIDFARKFPILDLAACADLNRQAAGKRAAEFSIPRVLEVEELLGDPSIDIVLNLTIPKAHDAVNRKALEHGKHVYAEKPLAITREEARKTLELAQRKNLRVGCAPDTFLGAGLQTARCAIDAGMIGKPVAFTAAFMCPGHEAWHPSPEFYYQGGGGPMLDMGPYYTTALLNLLGPFKRVMGIASIAIPDRVINSEPKRGKKIHVETEDHVCGCIEFEQGAVGTLVTSFAMRYPQHDGKFPITLFGEEATMLVPDPNHFVGPVKIRRRNESEFSEIPSRFEHEYGRAVGLAEMAHAIRTGRPHRASGDQGLASLDLMLGFTDSSKSGKAYAPAVDYQRPAPLPAGGRYGTFA